MVWASHCHPWFNYLHGLSYSVWAITIKQQYTSCNERWKRILVNYNTRLFREFVFYLLFVFIYVYWCSKRFPYHIRFESFNSNMSGVTNRAENAYPSSHMNSPQLFLCESCCSIFSFLCSRSLFVLLSFFMPLYCLSFLDFSLPFRYNPTFLFFPSVNEIIYNFWISRGTWTTCNFSI